MKRQVGVWVGAALLLGFTACSKAPPRTAHTVDEYKANDKLRVEQLDKCLKDPGTLGNTPDCTNAAAASHGSFDKRFRPTFP